MSGFAQRQTCTAAGSSSAVLCSPPSPAAAEPPHANLGCVSALPQHAIAQSVVSSASPAGPSGDGMVEHPPCVPSGTRRPRSNSVEVCQASVYEEHLQTYATFNRMHRCSYIPPHVSVSQHPLSFLRFLQPHPRYAHALWCRVMYL